MIREQPISPMHTSSPPNFNILAQELESEAFGPRNPPPYYERIYHSGDSGEVMMENVFSNPGRRAIRQQPVESALRISVPETQVRALPTMEPRTQKVQKMQPHRSPVAMSTASCASASSVSSPSHIITKQPIIVPSLVISAPADTPTRMQHHSITIIEQPRPLDQPVPSLPEVTATSKEPSEPGARRAPTVNQIPSRDPRANCLHGNHEIALLSSQAGIKFAMLCFPCGLLCCWLSRKERCTHCGKAIEELQVN